MSLSPRSIAVEGVGYGALQLALLGLWPIDELSAFSGGNARIGETPLLDELERAGPALLDLAARLGEESLAEVHGRAGGPLLDEEGRPGSETLAAADERVGAPSLARRERIGVGTLKRPN